MNKNEDILEKPSKKAPVTKVAKKGKPAKMAKASKPEPVAVEPQKSVKPVKDHRSDFGANKELVTLDSAAVKFGLQDELYDDKGGSLREQARTLMKTAKALGAPSLLAAGAALLLVRNSMEKRHRKPPTWDELVMATNGCARHEGYVPPSSQQEPRKFWNGYVKTMNTRGFFILSLPPDKSKK